MPEVKDDNIVVIPKMSEKEAVERYCTEFVGSTKGLEKLTVTNETEKAGWNTHLPVPLVGKAFKHPNQTEVGGGYIRVVYSKHNIVAIFSNNRFEELQSKVICVDIANGEDSTIETTIVKGVMTHKKIQTTEG